MGIFSRFFKGQPSDQPAPPRSDADVLAWAVLMGVTEAVADAIKRKIDINAVGKAGYPALNVALAKDKLDIAVMLLDAGANPNFPDPKMQLTPIHIAMTLGNPEIVSRLIAAGANVNAVAKGGVTALGIAMRKGFTQIAEMLIKAGANTDVCIEPPDAPPDQRGITPLIYASSTGDLPMVELLIRSGANVEKAKEDGLTPLVCAVFVGHIEVIQQLLAAGATVGRVRDIDPIELARTQGRSDIATILER